MLRVLVDSEDPILHNKVEGVSPDLDRFGFTSLMVKNMEGHLGIGLSANQIGISERAFAILLDGQPVVCYNPSITKKSKKKTGLVESCLSYPGMEVDVIRPYAVGVSYENEKGEIVKETLTGIEAKCFQHELDHLNGVTMLDVGTPLTTWENGDIL